MNDKKLQQDLENGKMLYWDRFWVGYFSNGSPEQLQPKEIFYSWARFGTLGTD